MKFNSSLVNKKRLEKKFAGEIFFFLYLNKDLEKRPVL